VDKSPELNLFAQLCGVEEVRSDPYSIYNALLRCVSLGERGWAPAIALVNVLLGGNVATPDVFTIIPPGYIKYVKRVALVNEATIRELLSDIPFRVHREIHTQTSTSDEEGAKLVRIEAWTVPLFGFYVEYEHPRHGVTRQLWVIYYAGTGDYPWKYFPAPTAVAEIVSEMLERGEERVSAPDIEILERAREVVEREGIKRFEELKSQGALPSFLHVRLVEKAVDEEGAPPGAPPRRRRPPPLH
jgi:hypothetical protein